jgi:hypothetical protein
MAKLKGPLFSVAAHGTVGKALTYSTIGSKTRGRYQRKTGTHTSEEQRMMREKFYVIQYLWKILTAPEKWAWEYAAQMGWVEVNCDHIFIPNSDTRRLATVHRNQYLPELLLGKGVPKTNQSVVYRKGDDGTYQAGVEFEIPRFQDNGDGTVTDLATGLMWIKDPSAIGGVWGTPGNPSTMTWAEAIDACEELKYAGHSDWRLPNIKELESLIDYSKENPCIDQDSFENTQDGDYWGGSMTQHGCDNIFKPSMGGGGKNWTPNKDEGNYVRPVRQVPTGRGLHRPLRRK